MIERKKDVRPFTEHEYAIIVLHCLIRILRRPGNWMTELVLPKDIDGDSADSREIVNALEYAIDAIRSYHEHSSE